MEAATYICKHKDFHNNYTISMPSLCTFLEILYWGSFWLNCIRQGGGGEGWWEKLYLKP